MTKKDDKQLGANIHDLVQGYQIDPVKLFHQARESGEHVAVDAFLPSHEDLYAIPVDMQTLGDYELIEWLGQGGTGKVYKARDLRNNNLVAIKILSPQYLSDEQRLLRFYMEAEAAASLSHPSIVHIHKVSNERGYHYMVMDYVEGVELSDVVEDQPMPPETAARVMAVIADVIDYVHRQGILHRDLKPSNVMIDTEGKLWVADFGVAKLRSGPTTVTTTGMLLGTPSYMPPEQVGGNSNELGPTCDVYSLGAMLYELLTTRPPFQGDSPYETLQKVINHAPEPLRVFNTKVPKALEAICLKCLEKDPRKRYQSAADLADELRSFYEGSPVQADSFGPLRSDRLRDALSAPASRSPCEPDIAERWGRILRWHALIWLALCLASHMLIWSNETASLAVLWGIGIISMATIFLGYRFYRYKPLTVVEHQALRLMLLFGLVASAFFAMQMYAPVVSLSPSQYIPLGFFLAAIAVGCLCVLVDGAFLFLALGFLGLPYAFVNWPDQLYLALGLVIGVGLFIPGRRFSSIA